ncbi:ribosomal protein bL12 [Candidatus Phytoplasma oryzae]|nr:ribosomal protein L7/L12 [Candidatus Phytoplasma oryzae]
MSKIDKNDFIKYLKEMSVSELNELSMDLKKEFNITEQFQNIENSQTEEKTKDKKFNVILKQSNPQKKILTIQLVRKITELGLFESKELVDKENSIIQQKLDIAKAEDIKKKLENLGSIVELQECNEEEN